MRAVGAAQPTRAGEAFTLVEMLIVMAIIALLVTIILPVLNSAKELARQSLCLANQRAMVTGLHSYAAENRSFPYNYKSSWYWYRWWGGGDRSATPHGLDANERWALGCISPYVGGPRGIYNLTGAAEGVFPKAYVCPSANLDVIYQYWPSDRYHACYWTNIAIRLNRGWGSLFDPNPGTYPDGTPVPPGDDGSVRGGGSGGPARINGACLDCNRWTSVYAPTVDSLPSASTTVFTGDTNENDYSQYQYGNGPAEWQLSPGWGWIHWSLGLDRHRDKMVLGYVDGRAQTMTRQYLRDNYRSWGTYHELNETTGTFMFSYPQGAGCQGSRIHDIRPPLGGQE